MRNELRLSAISIALLSAACGGGGGGGPQAVEIAEPFARVRSDFDGTWSGVLILEDTTRLRISSGQLLGPWVCGQFAALHFCVEAAGISSVEYLKWNRPKPNLAAAAVASVAVGIPAGIIVREDMKAKLEAEQEAVSAYQEYVEARASVTGDAPLPPTEERVADFAALASFGRCMGMDSDQLIRTNRADMARRVWVNRERCLPEAAAVFREAGERAKARRLGFIEAARARYESLACQGSRERGLTAPKATDISIADGDWMEEFRAVVSDPETYSYPVRPS